MSFFKLNPTSLRITDNALTLIRGKERKVAELEAGVISGGVIKDKVKFKKALISLLGNKKPKLVVTFPEDVIYSRSLSVPQDRIKDAEYIRELAQELFPVNFEFTYNDYQVLEMSKPTQMATVYFAAINKAVVDSLFFVFRELGISIFQIKPANQEGDKSFNVNLIPKPVAILAREQSAIHKLIPVFALIFSFLVYNLYVVSLQLADDYSAFVANQKKLVAIQSLVDTVYLQGLTRQHFEATQLHSQIDKILSVRLPFVPLFDALNAYNSDQILFEQVKFLFQENSAIPSAKITALSTGREATQQFKDSLSKNLLFSKVDLPLSSFSEKGKATIEVTLTFDEKAFTTLVQAQLDEATKDVDRKLPKMSPLIPLNLSE